MGTLAAPPGSELSPSGLLSLVSALQDVMQQEPAAATLLLQPPAAVPALLAVLRADFVAALGLFAAATSDADAAHSRPSSGLADSVMAAALGALAAPFAHANAASGGGGEAAEQAAARVQAALLSCDSCVPVLVGCLTSAAGGGEVLCASASLLARLVMATDDAAAAFVQAGGLKPAAMKR
jgi:hypothetical protein